MSPHSSWSKLAARVFARFGIDCCGGNTPLEIACATRGLDLEAVIAALEETNADGAETSIGR